MLHKAGRWGARLMEENMTRTGSHCTDVENQSSLYSLEPLVLERVLQQRDELWQMQNPPASLKLSPPLKISPSLIEGKSRHRMGQVSLGTGRELQPAEPCQDLPLESSSLLNPARTCPCGPAGEGDAREAALHTQCPELSPELPSLPARLSTALLFQA